VTPVDKDALGLAARDFKIAVREADEHLQGLYLALRHANAPVVLEGLVRTQERLEAAVAAAQALMGVLEASEWIEGGVSE
jgi:hypothetical protein